MTESDIATEIARRAQLKAKIAADKKLQALLLLRCKEDVIYFMNNWVWLYEPRNASKGLPTDIPLKLRPKQHELMLWLQEREETQTSGFIEKSRDEGGSFLILAFMLHHWLFQPGFAGAIGSRKEDLVDKRGDPDSLFEKLRFMLYMLPKWFMPLAFNRKQHDNFLRLTNPDIKASIKGEAGDEMGRGGRSAIYFVDEWAFIDRAEKVNAAISQNSNVRIKLTTPNGPGNLAFEERFSGRFPVFTLHWRDNPAKNHTEVIDGKVVYPWYEKQKQEILDEATLAQEINIDWHASVRNALIPAKYVQAALDIQLEEGNLRTAGLDVSDSGDDSTIYTMRAGGIVQRLRLIEGDYANLKAREAMQLATDDKVSILYYDRLGVGAAARGELENAISLPYKVIGIANSERPTSIIYEDDPQMPGTERFASRGDELWWSLMLRFKRTYERAEDLVWHPDEDCISLARLKGSKRLGTLVAQLSQPVVTRTGTGKIKVNKHGQGTASPDDAESLMYAFAHEYVITLPTNLNLGGLEKQSIWRKTVN